LRKPAAKTARLKRRISVLCHLNNMETTMAEPATKLADAGLAPVRCAIEVPGRPEEIFGRFVNEIGRWWPMSYTFGLDRFAAAVIEPRAGGRWFETDAGGKRTDWGEVRAFEPGRRLVLTFAISPDRKPEPPEKASELEIRFTATGAGTRIELEHRDFEKHGEGAEMLRNGMASRQGWPLLLASFARALKHSPQRA
jgi:uncharacterized protein YndB with AHSA1/START domain